MDAESKSLRYKAFISYRRTMPDLWWAKWLQKSLETYRLPKTLVNQLGLKSNQIGRIFRDEDELEAAPNLPEKIKLELNDSEHLIVVCSPNSRTSKWVNAEVNYYQSLGRHNYIYALLIEGDETSAFPPSLQADSKKADNPINSNMPLAIDFRKQPGERWWQRLTRQRNEKLRLLAALIGCRFDDLRQRDQERRRWQVFTASMFGVVIVLLLVSSMFYALFQQRQKEINLALTFFSRASEAKFHDDKLAAKLLFAKALTLYDDPEIRAKVVENWFSEVRWNWDASFPEKTYGGADPSDAKFKISINSRGKSILTTDWDGVIRIWDIKSGRLLKSRKIDGQELTLATHESSNHLAIGDKLGRIFILDLTNLEGSELVKLKFPVLSLTFSTDGETIVAGLDGGGLVMFRTSNGEKIHEISSHGYRVENVSYLGRDMKYFAWGAEFDVFLTNTNDLKTELLNRQTGWIESIAANPAGDLLAVAGEDRTIKILDFVQNRIRNLEGSLQTVMDITFDSDGQRIISGGRDGVVRVWRVSDGRQEFVLKIDKHEVHSVSTYEGITAIAAADVSGRLRVWSKSEKIEKLLIEPKPQDPTMNNWIEALFPSDEQGLLAVTNGGQTLIWRSIQESTSIISEKLMQLGVQSVDINPDGKQIAAIPYYLDEIILSELSGRSSTRSIKFENPVFVSWISDSNILVRSEDRQIWSIQMNGSEQLRKLVLQKGNHFDTHPATNQVAIEIGSGNFVVGSLIDQSLKNHCQIEESKGFAPKFNYIGNQLAILSTDRVSVWDLSECHRLWYSESKPTVVAFSRDNRWLAIADWRDFSVAIHDLSTGNLVSRLSGHTKPIRTLVFTKDNNYLVSGGEDKSIRAWDIQAIAHIFDAEPSHLLKRAEDETGLTIEEHEMAAIPQPLNPLNQTSKILDSQASH